MKFDKPKYKMARRVRAAVLLMSVAALTACAGATKKEVSAETAPAEIKILSTREYLPVRQYDKDGAPIEFIAAQNPYLDIKGRINKTAIFDFVAARKAYKSKDYNQADTLLNKIIATDKKLAGPWVMLGDIAVAKNDAATAIKHYETAIEVNELNVNAYLPLAKLYRLNGDFILAQNVYAKALTVWRSFPEAHLNLAILYDIYLNDSLQAQQHMEAYQFLTNYKDKKVARWLEEIQSRTGIAPNLYIGPSNTSQIENLDEANAGA